MLDFFKKTKKFDFSLKPLDEQCIPYACHYDANSILTKNGELMQVIKIEGYSEATPHSDEEIDLRAIIRKAITENVTDRKVAIWFHTLRRKRNLDSINYYSWTFAKDTHESWAQKNHWRDKFVNELYITLLYEGESYTDNKNFTLAFVPKILKKLHLKKLEENAQKLDLIVMKTLEVIKTFGGKRLSIVNSRLGFHSEILEFLSKIICLKSKRVALPIQSIDNIFCRSKVAFGGNTLEILDEKEKHFAALFSIKEYHEFAAKALDKFLRISSEYIITQTLNFVDSAEAKASFENFNYILSVSKDEELRENCGLASTMASDNGLITDYAAQQMTIMLVGESLEELQRSVSTVIKEIAKLGIVIVREDMHIALCFWSQLPGNFNFFRRTSYINTKRTASFASLHNTPSGKNENIWGNSVTLFRRENGAPHFFNFHIENNGNTIIAGPPESSCANITKFLISESSKYDPNVLYIDQYENSRVLIMLLGGRHELITLKGQKANFSFNPFSLADTPENHDFLKNWTLLLAFPNEDTYNEEQKEKIFSAFDLFIANIAKENRKISTFIDFIEDELVKSSLSLYCKPNKFGLLFDHPYDELGSGAKMLGFNISELLTTENSATIAPLMAYCMYKYNTILDEYPSICAINDASILLKNRYFVEALPKWLDQLTNNNAIALLLCNIKDGIHTNIQAINDKIATHLFFPSLSPKLYQAPFNLTDSEVNSIKNMKTLYRHFMIKQGLKIIIAELNLDGMDYAIKALDGKKDAIQAMEKAIAQVGDNPNRWVIQFYKNLFPELH
jgi:type IV secretion system protein VirB4